MPKAHVVASATDLNQGQSFSYAQLEPPSVLARFNPDGTLELWVPNQAPERCQAAIAKQAGMPPDKILIHSPLLGGFYGRHFLCETAVVSLQAIQLAKEIGRPVKVVWSRKDEFLRDAWRSMAAVRFRGGLDDKGIPIALEAASATEEPTGNQG
ncbi:molybdopterin cofactor-binding domain-containing protein [Cupriavidus sp. SK-4]|uniref:molybdopterin cofactor-binding domain-containing protein n=1 Tax=Cupriavidus sp. SK-4 TaxID=574750 RepID=UPI00190FAA46|nr:molybdopterin cofactor-binding domain-containing protein [Cupriavidus sp. SK-4]